jgi:hypothetical protein
MVTEKPIVGSFAKPGPVTPPKAETLQPVPRDDWERGILAIARDCGVSLSDRAFSSDERDN